MILPARAATTSEPNMEVEMSLAELTGRQLLVVYQNVADLKPRKTNPRTHSKKQIAQIAGAIRRSCIMLAGADFFYRDRCLWDCEAAGIADHAEYLTNRNLSPQTASCREDAPRWRLATRSTRLNFESSCGYEASQM